MNELILSPAVHTAFATFIKSPPSLALPLTLVDNTLHPLPAIQSPPPPSSFQLALNELKPVLSPKTPIYLLLRRDYVLIAISFLPYLAPATQRQFFLTNRHELVRQLGSSHFSQSLICKEIGEVTDARSWEERDLERKSATGGVDHVGCEDEGGSCGVQDAGYKRAKCRLCDRRMQNPIDADALDALRSLSQPGDLVQITVSPSLILTLLLHQSPIPPDDISAHIPPSLPTFTFYIHPTSSLLYFISYCPDAAPVKARMSHTMAVPGLLVHAEDVGVRADRTMEVHGVEEVEFGDEMEEGKERFRSMFRREGFVGTELEYGGMERDRDFAEGVR